MGLFVLPVLAGGLLMHWITFSNFRRLAAISGPYVDGQTALRRVWGRIPADLIQFCGKVPLSVGAATGLLVSAGFIFNEVFVFWFPNFAFAYLLLAVALTLNLTGDRAVRWGQWIALTVVLGGLLALCIGGIFFAQIEFAAGSAPLQRGWPLTVFMTGAVGAMGFDLALYGISHSAGGQRFPWRGVWFAFAVAGVVFALWGVAGIFAVPRSKLADSTISHIIIARTLWGETGRYIMGGVVIGGVFAAVNGLLFGVGRLLARLIHHTKPSIDKNDREETPTIIINFARIGLAILVAMAMAGGWAGEPALETFIRTGILFWLFHHLMVNLTAGRLLRWKRPFADGYRQSGHLTMQMYALAGLTFAIAGVFLGEPDLRTMLILLFAIPVTSGLVLLFSGWIRQIKPKQRWRSLTDYSTKTH